MSIVKEQEVKNVIRVKGTVIDVTPEALVIEDDKTGEIDRFDFEDFGMFLEKSISFTVSESSKREIGELGEEE